jgi:site-specific DNA-methyltransferase (adenine-specific)
MIIDERSGAGWRVIRGDSLLVLRDLPAEPVDAVITDPPYSSGGQFRGDRQAPSSEKYARDDMSGPRAMLQLPEVEGDSRDQRAFLSWCSLWLAHCYRIAKPGAFVAVFSDWRQIGTTIDAIQCGGFVYRGLVPWCKTNPRRGMGRLWQEAEFVAWGSKGALPMERDATSGPGRLVGEPLPSYWLEGSPREREHMTEKPPGVMADLAKQCVRGGVILDPFAGSGAGGVGALPEGRTFIGVETSPAYFDIACRRLAETEAGADRGSLTRGQPALFGPEAA